MTRFLNILRNAAFIATSYGYMLMRGKARHTQIEVRAVLVVQTAKMGDMVCATPVLRALKERFPKARVVVLGDAIGKEVLANSSYVDGYIMAGDGFLKILGAIRREDFDASIILVPDARAIALSFLGGVKNVVAPAVVGGYCPWMTKTYRLLLRLVLNVPHRMGHYAPLEYLQMLRSLGIHTSDTTKHLSYSDEARKNTDAFLRAHDLTEKKFAIISPSAGNKIKNWPADRFARVAEHLAGKGISVVVIGGKRDTEEVATMMRAVGKSKGIIDASEEFSIDELKALIARAGLFVAVDTGPIYIAEAFGVPTVDIVGPMDEREQPPIGPQHLIVVPPMREKPALHLMNARVYDEQEALRQTRAISVEMICEVIDELINPQ